MSRASHRSATLNACPRTTRQRSWEERYRKSTSGSATVPVRPRHNLNGIGGATRSVNSFLNVVMHVLRLHRNMPGNGRYQRVLPVAACFSDGPLTDLTADPPGR